MTDGVEDVLARVHARRGERESLERRLGALAPQLAEAQRRIEQTRALLTEEERDVEKLETFSPTRIMAGLRGDRSTDLERETAERDAARYRAAEAQARYDALLRDADGYHAQLAEYADVEQEYAAALDAKEAHLRANGSAPRLLEIAEERGALAARDKELAEAHAAAVGAAQLLAIAEEKLGSARSWSNWDAFGGGGMLTDMMKYDRMDEATASLRQCEGALVALSRELADLGLAAVGAVSPDSMTRGFDVWFDNIFSDLSVRSRIIDAHERVRHLRAHLGGVIAQLGGEHGTVQSKVTALDAERERLLTA